MTRFVKILLCLAALALGCLASSAMAADWHVCPTRHHFQHEQCSPSPCNPQPAVQREERKEAAKEVEPSPPVQHERHIPWAAAGVASLVCGLCSYVVCFRRSI